ncbi:cation:proton antiporter [Natranaeroarchaeum sulfidigenes]|uniref:Kef-type K+ transport system, membrane componentfused TrkA K+ transport system n=1 Tax=Natranaeroarchaeum sulfidigenes TaxID=2784880 RepID=A0A897MT36_9EURY|nr:cation:proton antiporter [Natranaeroarchaeum sulfidigenes]QSG01366.1 Kef-type K+ transport system, membrane componentfused TrkA K+ transport system [Natranaeroarchaeum sulfidigenes]
MAELELIHVGVMFAVLAVAGGLANRVGQSVIPFYLVAGILMGEAVLGSVGTLSLDTIGVAISGSELWLDPDSEFIHLGAELGIVFLLFFLGLEFSMDRLIESKDRIGKAGTIDLLNFLPGVLIGYFYFGGIVEAILLGGVVYISSSAIITKSLIDLGWIANDESAPMLGTLVYEDLVIALYLAVVSAILLGAGGISGATTDILLAIGVLFVLVFVVYFGTEYFQEFLEIDSVELTVLRTVAITVFVAGGALALGVSEAVAAFFVGMGFSSTSHVHEIEELLIPIRDVFAAVFFFWIGLLTDPFVFLDTTVAGLILAAVALSGPTKFLTGYLGGRVYDLDERRSFRVACGMTTRGEFSLIIAAIATSASVDQWGQAVTETIPSIAVGYVLVMSVLGTLAMQYADRLWLIAEPILVEDEDVTPAD